jgi:pyruvate,water dikinase
MKELSMKYIRTFSEIRMSDIADVGGKNASLGEMYSQLVESGVDVPNGFATSSEAYRLFLLHNKLDNKIFAELDQLDTSDVRALAHSGRVIRNWIMHAELPEELAKEIAQAYRSVEEEYGTNTAVAVRSSATAEDLPSASFAGQQETYLNISSVENLLIACKRVFASLFTDRAISYRVDKGFAHADVALSVGVQKMVRADLGASGVIFTLDTETGFRDVVLITSSYGLGENIVQGTVNPDEFYVYKNTLNENFRPILRRQLGEKAIKMVYGKDSSTGFSTKNVDVAIGDRQRFSINDDDVLELARMAVVIEDHYQKPMDIEWARDGDSGKLFILQARPETVHVMQTGSGHEVFSLHESGEILTSGKSVGKRMASGTARVIADASDMHKLKAGEVLITDITDPDWEPVMKIASAIITNRGGRTCHAAIVARELGVPAVVGCGDASRKVATGTQVTVSCAEGDTGYVYKGQLNFTSEVLDYSTLKKPATRIMLNLANPDQAFEASTLPVDGVGLARMEFIINNMIRVHPWALLGYKNLDHYLKKRIDQKISGYPDPESFYVEKLAEGIGTIAAAFYPRQVIVRLSDFKSNEYASLIGGELIEPEEENPMIGFRGASRYASEEFKECFRLECEAISRVRKVMGLDNLDVMVPFVRSVEEGNNVLELMAKNGLRRGKEGLKVFLMCEIPANALLAEQFLKSFDGFSIGSNDLTQLTLGVDRDSGLITGFDERNEAVMILMKMAIDACLLQEKYIGICGQAPSDYPEITRWLVKNGISSISLNPDSVYNMVQEVLKAEGAN